MKNSILTQSRASQKPGPVGFSLLSLLGNPPLATNTSNEFKNLQICQRRHELTNMALIKYCKRSTHAFHREKSIAQLSI